MSRDGLLWQKGERRVFFLAECGNNFGMPQVQLPIFPAGVTHINSEVAFEERDGKVYYFNGHLPVFVHEKSALGTFRLFSTQLVINGNATQAEISRAFGVPLVTVKRYVKLYRESGAAAFFAPALWRTAAGLKLPGQLHTPRRAEQPPHCRRRRAAPDRHLHLSRLSTRLTAQGVNPLRPGVHPALQLTYPTSGFGAYPPLWNSG